MVVTTESDEITQARKATVELLLGNHPLDCPVCDAGGECELQDMTFKYGAPESLYIETKQHREEQQWSPVVFFDRPRCILCYRCVRMCGEGMDVFALGIQNRGASSVIAPNVPAHMSPDDLAHVDCEQCGMCIDACPVGALTSGTYRYKTRPWEMNHVATVCTHCGDGCKTTLGVRSTSDGSEIVRGDNRDKSGINGDFLCNKGRYAFDFANHEGRITTPLVRENGELKPVSWEVALDYVGKTFREARDNSGGKSIGVIGGNRLTNEEAYLLQKFARTVLNTNNIDHHRTADYVAFAQARAGKKDRTASLRDTHTAPAIMILGGDPTIQAPATAWNIRTNVRNNRARLYIANAAPIKLRRQAKDFVQIAPFSYGALASFIAGDDNAAEALTHPGTDAAALHRFREAVRAEENLLVLLGSEFRGEDLKRLLAFGTTLPNRKFALLSDYANSRGASDMGLLPDMLPGYQPVGTTSDIATEYATPTTPGLNMVEIFDAAAKGELSALYVVNSNPVAKYSVDPAALKNTFVVVQDMFLTETAALADVVLPAANLYEKAGSVTNSYGDLQQVKKAGDRAGVRTDFEMIVRIADKMGANMRALVPFGKGLRADMGQTRGAQSGEADRHAVWLTAQNLEPRLSPFEPLAILDEIQRLVPGYNILRLQLLSGNDQHLEPSAPELVQITTRKDLVLPANDSLFTSGTLGRYSTMLSDLQANESLRPPTGLTQIETAAD
jgi:NADH-quinone oxidoreductase subunit G